MRPTPLACDVQALCGGCPLMVHDLAEQRARKLERVRLAFENAGVVRLRELPVEFVEPPSSLAYRNRLRLQITETGQIRFFNQHKVTHCAVLEPALRLCVEQLVETSRSAHGALARFAHLEVRSPDDDGTPAILFTPRSPPPSPDDLALLRALVPNAAIGVAGLEPMPEQRRSILDGVFARVPLTSFWQVNTRVNAQLVEHVRRGALTRNVRSFADLYAGAGNFALPLAAAGLTGVAIERDAAAIRALRRAAAEQGSPQVTAHAGDAIELFCQSERQPDLVVLDPPRRGAGPALRRLAERLVPLVALCSCNPESLARDVACLHDHRLEQLTLFDMFPQTEHVEALAWLGRRD